MDIAEMRREILEQRHGSRTAAHVRPRFAVRKNFALDQQLAVFRIKTGGLQNATDTPDTRKIEAARDAGARLARPNHVGRRAAAEKQSKGIHYDGFSAARLACQQIQARVETDAQAINDGIVLNGKLEKHL